MLRGLIDKVVLTPREDGGVDLMLHGDLARILAFCEAGSGKERPSEAGATEGQLSFSGALRAWLRGHDATFAEQVHGYRWQQTSGRQGHAEAGVREVRT